MYFRLSFNFFSNKNPRITDKKPKHDNASIFWHTFLKKKIKLVSKTRSFEIRSGGWLVILHIWF